MGKRKFDMTAWVAKSRAASGVPAKVQDKQTLRALARLFRTSK
jgi:hypothetical protein